MVLYDTRNSPEVNISQLLIQKKHAISTEKDKSIGCCTFVEPESNETVIVTAVNNPGEFWVHLTRVSDQLDAMMDKLYEVYSQLKASDLCVLTPMIGQYCCAQFTEDDGWYRAVIDEVNGTSVSVNYIDYGNAESLNIQRIKVLSNDFDGQERFALPCQLSGLQEFSEWDLSVNSLLLGKEFNAHFMTKNGPCEVKLKSDGKLLNDELAALVGIQKNVPKEAHSDKVSESTTVKVAPQEVTATEIGSRRFKDGECVQVYFLEASSPHSFYCQPVDTENELIALMDDIAKHVESGESSPCNNFEVGGVCLARYPADEGWYRAEVLQKSKTGVRDFRIQTHIYTIVCVCIHVYVVCVCVLNIGKMCFQPQCSISNTFFVTDLLLTFVISSGR